MAKDNKRKSQESGGTPRPSNDEPEPGPSSSTDQSARRRSSSKQKRKESTEDPDVEYSFTTGRESFRPQRSVDEHANDDDADLISNVPPMHKPPASAYNKLEAEDQNIYEILEEASSRRLFSESFLANTSDVGLVNPVRRSSPKQHPKWRKFRRYIYNKENDAYCNRTLSSWCAICNYYGLLMLGFFGIFMLFIMTFIWRGTDGTFPAFLKTEMMEHPNPALALVPLANYSKLIIWYKHGSALGPERYVRDIDHFLDQHSLRCNQSKLLKQPCNFDIQTFGPCSKRDYGYDEKKPCIFLKLNNLATWMPTAMIKGNLPNVLSPGMRQKISVEAPRTCVYVECKGVRPYDQEHIGVIDYYPEPAFDGKYFPASIITKTNPVVAMKLSHIIAGYAVELECTLLAGNIVNRANSIIKLSIYVD